MHIPFDLQRAVPVPGPGGGTTSNTGTTSSRSPVWQRPTLHTPCGLGGEPSANPALAPGQLRPGTGAGLLLAWRQCPPGSGARLKWQRTLITVRPVPLCLSQGRGKLAAGGAWRGHTGRGRLLRELLLASLVTAPGLVCTKGGQSSGLRLRVAAACA